MILNEPAILAGYANMGVGALYALIILSTALKGSRYDPGDVKVFRTMIVVSLVMFILDYLMGPYKQISEAARLFSDRMGIFAFYGIVLMVISVIVLVLVRVRPSIFAGGGAPDVKTIRDFLTTGLIITFISLLLRWLMTGKI